VVGDEVVNFAGGKSLPEEYIESPMPRILDPLAPSVSAEYARYIDGDLMGKLLTRNFLVNRLGYKPENVITPIGRYGDARVKYITPGVVNHDPGDGHIEIDGNLITFEVKFARVNIANRSLGQFAKNWAFVNLKNSPGKARKKYDILIAIGVLTLGLEDENYWADLYEVLDSLRQRGLPQNINALPHEPEYLSLCSFFIMPMTDIQTNYFRVTIDSIENSRYAKFRAWGYDEKRCKELWLNALQSVCGI
jgi:hypothetical protein